MRKLLFFACFFLFLTVIFPAYFAKTYAQQDSIDSPVQLKVLSWNIFMLPEFITFTNKVERAIEIGEMLRNSDYDVIVLQEAFMKKARVIIYEMIKDSFPYIIEPANNEGFSFKANSGVWILSKIKLNLLGTTKFSYCKGIADCMARKGAMMVEGEKQGKKFHLIGTHLQAENYPLTRKKQFRQIQEELISRFSKKDVPLIIGGDLNTEKMDTLNYKDMLTSLDAEDGELDGDVQSTWGGMNYKFDKKDKNPILDYILLRKNGKKVKVARRKVNIFRSQKADYNLSDHFGVEMEMVF